MLEPSHNDELPVIPGKRYFTIGEVSELCAVKPHVLRYWEQEFPQLNPVKRTGNRRYYQRQDVLMIRQIRALLYDQVRREDPVEEESRLRQEAEDLASRLQFEHAEAPGLDEPEALAQVLEGASVEDVVQATEPARNEQKLGRNELCYCGSGKK